jgi:hypothetical protein
MKNFSILHTSREVSLSYSYWILVRSSFSTKLSLQIWPSNWTSAFTRQNTVYEFCFGELLSPSAGRKVEKKPYLALLKKKIFVSTQCRSKPSRFVCVRTTIDVEWTSTKDRFQVLSQREIQDRKIIKWNMKLIIGHEPGGGRHEDGLVGYHSLVKPAEW